MCPQVPCTSCWKVTHWKFSKPSSPAWGLLRDLPACSSCSVDTGEWKGPTSFFLSQGLSMCLYVGGLRSADAHVCLASAAVKKGICYAPHSADHQVFRGIQTRVFIVREQMIHLLTISSAMNKMLLKLYLFISKYGFPSHLKVKQTNKQVN